MKNLQKRAISLLMAFCILMSFGICVRAADENEFDIKIVHTNDIHARVEEDEKSGIIGMEKLSSIIKSFTQDSGNVTMDLVLNSGDLFHGLPIATLDKGESIAKLVKECGFDAMTSGNHDWSYGKERLKELGEKAGVVILDSNVFDDNTGTGFFENDEYVETATVNNKELKVGVFGVIDQTLKNSTTPSNVEGLTFADTAEYANKAAAKLRDEGCDIIIALTHTNKPAELAGKVGGVDLWLAGHEHIQLNEEVTDADGKKTRIVENKNYLQLISLIDISGTLKENGTVGDLNITVEQKAYEDVKDSEKDENITRILENIKSEQDVILTEKVGYTPESLNGVWEDIRIDQQNLGNVISDAYLLETGADVAFENAGGIRASVDRGDVTYGDIIGVSPYGNYVVTKEVSGAQLKEIMETSLEIQMQCRAANDSGLYDAWPETSGSYLQFGGMTVVYNSEAEKGQRVKSVLVQGDPLDDEKMYTVAANNYTVISDDYPALRDAEEKAQFTACDEVLVSFFEQDESKIATSIYSKRLYDENNSSTSFEIISDGSVIIYSPVEQKAVFIMADYDGDKKLVNVNKYNADLSKGLNKIDVKLETKDKNSGSVRMFMWSGFELMQPFVSATAINIG